MSKSKIKTSIMEQQSKIEGIHCHKCKKPATGRYSPNNEELGLAFCDEHKDLMGVAFYCLMKDNIKDFNELMGTNL